MELTETFRTLLETFAPVFTAPSFRTWVLLLTGWVVSSRQRFVTDLIVSSDSTRNGHFSDYHRFFSHAKWDLDHLWRLLAEKLVAVFVGADGVILLAADDTLCRQRGLSLFGVGMHHDPLISSRAMRLVSWGHDWVILSLIVVHPWWAPTKVFALPICARLYRNRQGLTNGQKSKPRQSRAASKGGSRSSKRATKSARREAKRAKSEARHDRRTTVRATGRAAKTSGKGADSSTHRTRPELLREMLVLVAAWFPQRRFLLTVDSLYSGESVLRYLPSNVDLIGPVHSQAALFAPPPPRGSTRGAPRKKGKRLPDRDAWTNDHTKWQRLKFDQYGLHTTLQVKTRTGLYYTAGRERLLQFVLSRDATGQRPTQIFYCTDLTLTAHDILSNYSRRWSVEVMHHDVKQLLGFDDPANRVPLAVSRTAPMALVIYSLTVLWFAETGHKQLRFPHRPWYRRKQEPSFGDMLTTLRNASWNDQFSGLPQPSAPWKNKLNLLKYLATLAG